MFMSQDSKIASRPSFFRKNTPYTNLKTLFVFSSLISLFPFFGDPPRGDGPVLGACLIAETQQSGYDQATGDELVHGVLPSFLVAAGQFEVGPLRTPGGSKKG